jgi:hypothetical protein
MPMELKKWYLIEVSHCTTMLYSTLEEVQTEEKLRYSLESRRKAYTVEYSGKGMLPYRR